MPERKDIAKWIAIIGGILLIIAGINGLVVWEDLKVFILDMVGPNSIIETVFLILIILASFGGIAVIAGGFFLGRERILLGRILIFLGAGLISVGAVITLVPLILNASDNSGGMTGLLPFGIFGLLFSFIALFMVRDYKPHCNKCNKRIPPDSIFCPYCGKKGTI